MRHYDFQRPAIGVIEWGAILPAVGNFLTSIFGGDKVPNYPIKTQSTLIKLQEEVRRNVTLPPTSVEDAKVQLQRAQAALQREMSGSGVANQSIRMMYQEVIQALQSYIATAGASSVPPVGSGGGTTPYIPPGTPAKQGNFLTDTGLFNLPNWVTIGGGVAIVYFLTRKKRRR